MADHPQVYYPDDGLQVHYKLSEETTAIPEIKQPAPAHHGSSEKSNALLGLKQSASTHYDLARKNKRIMGLRRQTFWLVVILVIVIIATAVGGGVGGSLAVQRARSKTESTPTTTATATSTTTVTSATPYVPIDPTEVPRIDNSCPPDNEVLTAYNGTTFQCLEQKDFVGSDIIGIVAYTLQACIDACVTFNKMNSADFTCHAVVLVDDMDKSYASSGGNCWLKRTSVSESDLVQEVTGTTARLCPTLSGCLN